MDCSEQQQSNKLAHRYVGCETAGAGVRILEEQLQLLREQLLDEMDDMLGLIR